MVIFTFTLNMLNIKLKDIATFGLHKVISGWLVQRAYDLQIMQIVPSLYRVLISYQVKAKVKI